jgi:arylsulfatase A-like enzyme
LSTSAKPTNFAKAEHFGKSTHLTDTTTRSQRRAYFAAASFADAQIGKVLRALEETGYASSTVITLW